MHYPNGVVSKFVTGEIGSLAMQTASRTKEGAEDLYDSAAETFGSAKEKTHEKTREAKDKVYEGAEAAHDAVVDNARLGIDKTKGTATDAAEKVKETGELAAHETKEAGQGILGRVKDAACRTAECLRARAHEAGSFLPHVGQGLGYMYNDGKAAAGDTAETLKQTANSAAENAGETTQNAKERTQDTASKSYNRAKDTAGDYYQDGRNWAEDKYDSGRDTIREYYDEAGRRYRSARDYYDEPSNYYTNKGGRQRQYRDRPSRYYDAAKEEIEDIYDQRIRDPARHAYRSARDTAEEYYDDARDRIGRYIPGRYQETPRDYYSAPRRRASGPYRGGHEEEDYKRRSFKPDEFQDLAAIVESMGWRRVGKVPKDHVGVKSSREVVIGNEKYVWQGKGEPRSDELHDTVFHHMTNSVKGAAHTVGEKLGFVKDRVKDGAGNVRDSIVRGQDEAYYPADDPWAKHVHYWEGYDDDERKGEEDPSIITRGTQNLKERVRNAGQAFEAQRSKAGEFADEARQELAGFGGGKAGDRAHHLRSWTHVFSWKLVGMPLALARALHLFTFSTVYGSAIWVTFVSGLILSKHVPRQQFGYVQSRMFPMYLRMLGVGEGVLLLLHSLLHPWFSSESIERMQLLCFAVMIASTLFNAYVVEPRATKVRTTILQKFFPDKLPNFWKFLYCQLRQEASPNFNYVLVWVVGLWTS